jgi:sigma-E factor negative regulatory protein RseA
MKSPPITLQPEDLSALCDGEVDDATLGALSAAWRDDESLRARWHRYQLIGDVLRSEDLARAPAADAAFLLALRERLASEPVVLAPTTEVAPDWAAASGAIRPAVRRRWLGSGAIAAGFVAVAAAVFVMQPPVEQAAVQLAATPPAAAPTVAVGLVDQPATANSMLVRDAGLERYLAAHQQFGGNSALAVPSGFLRNATYEGPSR